MNAMVHGVREGPRLSPATPRGLRALALAAAVVVHGAMAMVAVWLPDERAMPVETAIEVVLIELPDPVAAPSGAAEAPPPPEDVAEEIPEPEPQVAAVPEPPAPPDPVAGPVLEPPPPVQVAAPAPEPLPPPPSRRPPPPVLAKPPPAAPPAAVPSAEPARSPAPEPRAAPVEAPVVAAVPPPAPAARAAADYVSVLLGWLDRHKEYPRAARLRRIEGTVIVRIAVLADGRLASLVLARSSGHAILDDASLDMMRRAAPLPRPPDGAIDFDVPVVFAQSAR